MKKPIERKRWYRRVRWGLMAIILSAAVTGFFTGRGLYLTPTPKDSMAGKVWIEFRDIQHALDNAALIRSRMASGRVTVCMGPGETKQAEAMAYVYPFVNLLSSRFSCASMWPLREEAGAVTVTRENEVGGIYIHNNFIRGTWASETTGIWRTP